MELWLDGGVPSAHGRHDDDTAGSGLRAWARVLDGIMHDTLRFPIPSIHDTASTLLRTLETVRLLIEDTALGEGLHVLVEELGCAVFALCGVYADTCLRGRTNMLDMHIHAPCEVRFRLDALKTSIEETYAGVLEPLDACWPVYSLAYLVDSYCVRLHEAVDGLKRGTESNVRPLMTKVRTRSSTKSFAPKISSPSFSLKSQLFIPRFRRSPTTVSPRLEIHVVQTTEDTDSIHYSEESCVPSIKSVNTQSSIKTKMNQTLVAPGTVYLR
ncbi:hypothetical protein FA95DRAFT_1565715 [Auriscalpium vulgare]|uniref:Uncharacterized protein n=1 Tax=Auriscalpium vulgare TaxID=40419 RepID=A0ACB8RAF2_9AGAM|nr:hypothetical protein FA95DRAFT_1565715 [Auriscalpium vulgare]